MERTKQVNNTKPILTRTKKKPKKDIQPIKPRTHRPPFDINKKYTVEELEDILSDRHKEFVKQYLLTGFNGARSYSIAYGIENTLPCRVAAHKLLTDSYIKAYLALKRNSFEDLVGISKQSQLQEYKKIAYASVKDLRNGWMDMQDWDDIVKNNPDILSAVSVVDTKEETTLNQFKQPVTTTYIKIKMHDKIKALERIDKLIGYDEPERISVVVEQPLFPEL